MKKQVRRFTLVELLPVVLAGTVVLCILFGMILPVRERLFNSCSILWGVGLEPAPLLFSPIKNVTARERSE